MWMKLFRAVVLIAFVITSALFGYYFFNAHFNVDKTYPEITIDTDTLEIPLSATDGDLLAGVTAQDGKDGDITDKVLVESISKFTTKGVSTVTYAVCDSDNHVSEATRTVTYKNYTSPKFTMSSSFCFSTRVSPEIKGVVGATDCIDGDISDSVIITSSDYEAKTEGYYTCNVVVTNSKGDTSSIDIPLVVENRSPSAPVINLTDYLIYVKKGETPDFRSYIDSVTDSYDSPLDITPEISSEFKSDIPGVYSVNYYATDDSGRTGHTILIVVVEE